MSPHGLKRKILFGICSDLRGITLKDFSKTITPAVSPVAVAQVLTEQSHSKRINLALREFIIETATTTGLELHIKFINSNAKARRIRSLNLFSHKPPLPRRRK